MAGFTTALQSARLWLLGSPPDQIHGLGLHGTRPEKFIID